MPARTIPAYTLVTKEFMINPKTGAWEVVWTPPNLVPKDAILDLAKIRGRVMAHEKPPYYCFMEKDFLPQGTRPGIVGRHSRGQAGDYFGRGQTQGRA